MSNKEFDKKVRELMEAHKEVPRADLWDSIEFSLIRKKRAKVLYFRRTLYTTVAVAASLVILLVLNKSSDNFDNLVEVVDKKEVIATLEPGPYLQEKPSIQEKPSAQEKLSAQKKGASIEKQTHLEKLTTLERPATSEEVVSKEKSAISEKPVTSQETTITEITEKVSEEDKQIKPHSYPPLEDYKSVKRRKGSPLLAFATNLSPSTGSHSVSLMAVSQAEGGFAPNDVVSTVQKASVPQEVISNTKFLMPVSVGVQLQMPISTMLSVGLGANYTLLFSNYDALSRQETRETQQTLHYIGIPLNLYLNVMQKDNLRFYATGGIALEKGVYAFYRVSENGVRRTHGESISGLQWSVTGGLGVELAVNNSTGLYFDPTVAYYFDNNQPLSSRTSQPLQFKFELGFRFHL